jgi:hypothetical protein
MSENFGRGLVQFVAESDHRHRSTSGPGASTLGGGCAKIAEHSSTAERMALSMVHDSIEGWYKDPFGLHAARWFSDGTPTQLVRDGDGAESYDQPPSPTYEGELEPITGDPADDGSDLLRADAGNPDDQIFDPNAAVGGVWEDFGESGGGD